MYRERFISGYTNIPDIYLLILHFQTSTNHHKICVELSYRKRWYWLKLHRWAVPASMLPRDPMHRWPVHNPWSERSNESPAGFFLTTFPTLADVGGWTHQPNLKNMQPSNWIMKPPSFGMKNKNLLKPPTAEREWRNEEKPLEDGCTIRIHSLYSLMWNIPMKKNFVQ